MNIKKNSGAYSQPHKNSTNSHFCQQSFTTFCPRIITKNNENVRTLGVALVSMLNVL